MWKNAESCKYGQISWPCAWRSPSTGGPDSYRDREAWPAVMQQTVNPSRLLYRNPIPRLILKEQPYL